LTKLIGETVKGCFGVAEMSAGGKRQVFFDSLPFCGHLHYLDKGVLVAVNGAHLYIDLHIVAVYGVSIPAVVESARQKVRYVVEEETGLTVKQINVYVDEIR
jgi:uncharacterized alkaline shock family protein YloU